MNIETGEIRRFTDRELAAMGDEAEKWKLIEESALTTKQRGNMSISLHDTNSVLGKKLHAYRSRYLPHVGKKELAKLAKRNAT